MCHDSLSVELVLEEIGSVVHPTMEKYLASEASPAFREALLYPVKTGAMRSGAALVMLSARVAGGKDEAILASAAFGLAQGIILTVDEVANKNELGGGGVTSTRSEFGQATAILIAAKYREAIAKILSRSRHSDILGNLVSKVLDGVLEGEMFAALVEKSAKGDPLFGSTLESTASDDRSYMVEAKAGLLFAGCCRAGAIVAGASKEIEEALASYGFNLGCLLQIKGDASDVFGAQQEFGDSIDRDSVKHKVRDLVLLLSLQSLCEEKKEVLSEGLARGFTTQEEIRETMNMLSSAGLEEECLALASKYQSALEKALSRLPDSQAKSTLEALPEVLLGGRC